MEARLLEAIRPTISIVLLTPAAAALLRVAFFKVRENLGENMLPRCWGDKHASRVSPEYQEPVLLLQKLWWVLGPF